MSSFASSDLVSELLVPAAAPTFPKSKVTTADSALALDIGGAKEPAADSSKSVPTTSPPMPPRHKAWAKAKAKADARAAQQQSFPPATQADMQPLCTPPIIGQICTSDMSSRIVIVDDADSIQMFQSTIDSLRELMRQPTPEGCTYNPWVVGIDTEWMPWLYLKKPSALTSVGAAGGKPNPSDASGESPVAIMQVGTRLGTFILDMQTVSSPTFPAGDCLAINEALRCLLGDSQIYKLGYDLAGDMERVAASHGQLLPALLQWNGILDLNPLSRIVYPNQVTKAQNGLSRVCSVSFGRSIDKQHQLSPWHQRPLSPSQLLYAALDGAVLVRSYDAMVTTILDKFRNANVDRYFEQRELICNTKYSVIDGCVELFFEDKSSAVSARSTKVRQHKSKYVLGKTLVSIKWPRQRPEPLFPAPGTIDGLEG